jgi:hypothetical protein
MIHASLQSAMPGALPPFPSPHRHKIGHTICPMGECLLDNLVIVRVQFPPRR